MKERLADPNFSKSDEGDLMTMLMKDELYGPQPETIIDDILGMFLAGTITIQVSSTNMILYSTYDQEVQKLLIEEVDRNLDPISDDLKNKFTIDVADNFDYML